MLFTHFSTNQIPFFSFLKTSSSLLFIPFTHVSILYAAISFYPFFSFSSLSSSLFIHLDWQLSLWRTTKLKSEPPQKNGEVEAIYIYRPIYKENIEREWKFESSWKRSQLGPCWRISTLTRTSLWGTRNGNSAVGCWGLSEEASVFVPHVFEFCLLTNRRRILLPTHVSNTKLYMFCIIPTINGGTVLKSFNRWSTFLDLFNQLSTFARVISRSSAGWIWIGIEESRNCFPRYTWEFPLKTWVY